MKVAKKQIVLGALILALGSAVYLNWQFDSVKPVEATNSPMDNKSEVDDEDLGIAQLVNNSYVETVNDTIESGDTNALAASNTMSQARMTREETRDAALEILSDVLEDVEGDADAVKLAIEESAQIAQDMLMESTAENLIKAKGIDDVVVFISDDSCNVIVQNLGDNTLIIQEIVVNETQIPLENIQIIDAK